ncbi:FecR family protein [Puteibacter caeruleilacunae]|nr:FecR family protein [Puteibacter caeruleilacunae]
MKKNIDFSIIWRKLNQRLGVEEEGKLNDWLDEDARRKDYFERAQQYKREGSKVEQLIDIEGSRKKVAKKIFIYPRIRKIINVAAIFIGVIVLVGGAKLYYDSLAPVQQVTLIEPGRTKATLILSDGSKYDLDASHKNVFKEKDAVIVKTGKELAYKSQSPKFKLRKKKQTKINTLKVPRGGEFFLVLSDSTKVWLNSESVLRYPVIFDKDHRTVELIGEAYFEVAHNASKPFHVKTDKQTIQVLGTSFNINAYPDENVNYTTLVEGKVDVVSAIDLLHHRLEPGMQCVYDKQNDKTDVKTVNVAEYISWKDGKYIFRNKSLEDMMYTLARWYDVHVTFANSRSRKVKFKGNLRRKDKFEDILTIIETTNEVKFEINGKNVTIR